MVLQKARLHQLVLDILNFADEIEVASPAWHLLVDLLVLVDDADLFSEMLFVQMPVNLDQIPPIVELFVVDEDVGFGEPSLGRFQEFFVQFDFLLVEHFLHLVFAIQFVYNPELRLDRFLRLFICHLLVCLLAFLVGIRSDVLLQVGCLVMVLRLFWVVGGINCGFEGDNTVVWLWNTVEYPIGRLLEQTLVTRNALAFSKSRTFNDFLEAELTSNTFVETAE